MRTYDLAVIGGGPAGYTASIRARQLGLSCVCIEKRGSLGGTCLNVGCIPSKALLQSSWHYAQASGGALAAHGVRLQDVHLDLSAMQARKDKIVADLRKGISFLFRKNSVSYMHGRARISKPGEIVVALSGGGEEMVSCKHILLATGSESASLPGLEIDEQRVLSSTGALSLRQIPKRMVIVGAGAIGLELGSVWSRLGSRVEVVEFLDRILPGMDAELADKSQRLLVGQGLSFRLSTRVLGLRKESDGVVVSMASRSGGSSSREGAPQELVADVVLVAVGRRPCLSGLGLQDLDIRKDSHGFLCTDDDFQTTVEGIYAVGDCIAGPMLAHKAEAEGVAAVEMLATGGSSKLRHSCIPSVVYTFPEIASVGASEESLRAAGRDFVVGKFPMSANSRARTIGETDGFVKVVSDRESDRILGVHILAPEAGELISEAVLAMEFCASSEDLARTCHAHPGLGESLKEAALAVGKKALHI